MANLPAGVDTSAANRRARVSGIVRNGSTAGTVIVRFASETPGQAVTIRDALSMPHFAS